MSDKLKLIMGKIEKKKNKLPEIEEEDEEDEEEEEQEEEDEEDEEEVEEKPKKIKKKEEKSEKQISDEEFSRQRDHEIAFLQNNGIFRTELLIQLQQINKNLSELASIIKNLSE